VLTQLLTSWDILNDSQSIADLLTQQKALHASLLATIHESHVKYRIKEIELAFEHAVSCLPLNTAEESAFHIREDLVIDKTKGKVYEAVMASAKVPAPPKHSRVSQLNRSSPVRTTAIDTEVPNERSSSKVTSASQKASEEKRLDPETVTSPPEEKKEHSTIKSFFIDTFAKI
jgi:hypothetical protein